MPAKCTRMRLAPTAFEQGGDFFYRAIPAMTLGLGVLESLIYMIPTGIDDLLTVHVLDHLI